MFIFKLFRRTYAHSLLWSTLSLFTGYTNAVTYFTLEHESGYKIRDQEYENARHLYEAAIYLDKKAAIRLPVKSYDSESSLHQQCYKFLENPGRSRPAIQFYPLPDLSSHFLALVTLSSGQPHACNQRAAAEVEGYVASLTVENWI